MSFFDCEFPRAIGFIATGGDSFMTQVNEGFSGVEQRNRNWSKSKRRFQLPFNGKTFEYYQLTRAFFLNVGGRADAFRFFWPLDSSVSGQSLGAGNAVKTVFQLVKTYTVGGRTYSMDITKPIMSTVQNFKGEFLTDTVRVYLDAAEQVLHTDFEVNASTGEITFDSAPGNGVAVTADCEFHIPVRFDVDSMQDVQILSHDLDVKWPNVSLIEDRRA